MKHLAFLFSLWIGVGFSCLYGQAPSPVTITIVIDEGGAINNPFLQSVQTEIDHLLGFGYDSQFKLKNAHDDPEKVVELLQEAYQDNETDIVIGLGSMSSNVIIHQSAYPKPTIATVVIDPQLQQVPLTAEGTSGIENFSYIAAAFDIERDLNSLYEIYPYKHLGILSGRSLSLPFLTQLFTRLTQKMGAKVSFIPVEEAAKTGFKALDTEIDAVYALPFLTIELEQQSADIFKEINARKLPSAALLGERYVEAGALLAYESENNIARIPRRVALNVMKIVEGTPAANLPVAMETYTENMLLNMATAREIGKYPTFDMMSKAKLVNMNKIPTQRQLSLKGAIVEGLQENLAIKIAASDVGIAEKEIGLAIASLLPQADITSALTLSDQFTALSYQGVQGRTNWLASGSASQLIFSEPAFANVTIQKLLKKSEEFALKQSQLDVVIDVATAYMNILQAQNNLRVQQKNVDVTKENYDIAKTKNTVGYSGFFRSESMDRRTRQQKY